MSLICPTVRKWFSAKVAKNIYDVTVPLTRFCRCCFRQNDTKKNDQLRKNEEASQIHHCQLRHANCQPPLLHANDKKNWLSVAYVKHTTWYIIWQRRKDDAKAFLLCNIRNGSWNSTVCLYLVKSKICKNLENSQTMLKRDKTHAQFQNASKIGGRIADASISDELRRILVRF